MIAADATGELQALARRLEAPVITSVMGRGAISEADPLWLGVLPNQRATKAALEAADVILAVGCRFSHRSTKGLLLNLELRPDQALIQLDLDPRTIGRMHAAAIGLSWSTLAIRIRINTRSALAPGLDIISAASVKNRYFDLDKPQFAKLKA